jgi:hypothetical protein
MLKSDEIEHTESCFNKARDDERLFVLLARDPAAPAAIRAWVAERVRLGKNHLLDDQIVEALECATLMEAERAEIESARRQQKMRWAEGGAPAMTTFLTISRSATPTALPTRESLSWQQLAALFSEPRRAMCTVADCQGSSCVHKIGECWSPAVFNGNRRKQNVEAISCLVLDVDHATDAAVEALRSQLVDYQHLIHTTHADRLGDHCMRVVVQLSRAVTLAEWPRFWQAAVVALGVPADPACGDAARCWYLPNRPHDADYFAAVHAGKPLDVDALLTSAAVRHDPAEQIAAQEGVAP